MERGQQGGCCQVREEADLTGKVTKMFGTCLGVNQKKDQKKSRMAMEFPADNKWLVMPLT